ncbi:hypothetical protein N1851_002105 [Merluccius polli]|uniref:Uncharacterized protein n=1 Tax=Merluccius polli TaxID=89951 RepID=A0AA47NBK6_MERPO|nr:hypothetical protein N1851_002105 [Merluccius polli]
MLQGKREKVWRGSPPHHFNLTADVIHPCPGPGQKQRTLSGATPTAGISLAANAGLAAVETAGPHRRSRRQRPRALSGVAPTTSLAAVETPGPHQRPRSQKHQASTGSTTNTSTSLAANASPVAMETHGSPLPNPHAPPPLRMSGDIHPCPGPSQKQRSLSGAAPTAGISLAANAGLAVVETAGPHRRSRRQRPRALSGVALTASAGLVASTSLAAVETPGPHQRPRSQKRQANNSSTTDASPVAVGTHGSSSLPNPHGGWNNNPSASQFQAIFRHLRCGVSPSTSGNVAAQDETVSLSAFEMSSSPAAEETEELPSPFANVPALVCGHSYLPTRFGGLVDNTPDVHLRVCCSPNSQKAVL